LNKLGVADAEEPEFEGGGIDGRNPSALPSVLDCTPELAGTKAG
jgi:hypothetical protein